MTEYSKNRPGRSDHLGLVIMYTHKGVVRKYYPYSSVELTNDEYLILETKGKDSALAKTKQAICRNGWRL